MENTTNGTVPQGRNPLRQMGVLPMPDAERQQTAQKELVLELQRMLLDKALTPELQVQSTGSCTSGSCNGVVEA
jgi:hypothetical protein